MSALTMFQIGILVSLIALGYGWVFYRRERADTSAYTRSVARVADRVFAVAQERDKAIKENKALKRSLVARKGADTKRAKKVLKHLTTDQEEDYIWLVVSRTSKQSARRKMESLLDLRGKIDWDNVDA